MQPRRREVPRRSRGRQLTFLLRGASCPSCLHGPAPGNATTKTRSSTKITKKTTGVSSSWRFVSFVPSRPGTWKCNHEDTKLHEEHEEDNWRFFFVALRVLRVFAVPAPGNATTKARSSTKITKKTTGVSSSWSFV